MHASTTAACARQEATITLVRGVESSLTFMFLLMDLVFDHAHTYFHLAAVYCVLWEDPKYMGN